jgi:sugar/nucleoside kinase (ribokinase family)
MTMPWSSHRALVSALEPAAGSILLDPYPTYMVKASDAALRELLQRVCVLLPSEVEVRSRFPDLDIPTGAQRLLDLGCGAVVVKLGAHGSLVLRREHRMVAVPAYQTLAKDPTGAGDAFMGGFAAGLLETGDLLEAALYGTVAASFAVQEFGLLHLLSVERQDAEHRLDALRRLRYSGTL